MTETGISSEKFNTWGYVLKRTSGSAIVSVAVELECTTFNSSSTVKVKFNNHSEGFAREIQQKLQELLGYIAPAIKPVKLKELMTQEWAKVYYPQYYYIPSVNISSIVRPYANQDSIPPEIVTAIAGELDTTEDIAEEHANIVKSRIKSNSV